MTEPAESIAPCHARIVRALREYHAANNSAARALAELCRLIPANLVVLHKLPGEPDGPGTLYWTYQGHGGGVAIGVDRGPGEWRHFAGREVRALIVEAPAPRTEYLPRLEQGGAP